MQHDKLTPSGKVGESHKQCHPELTPCGVSLGGDEAGGEFLVVTGFAYESPAISQRC